MTIFYIAYFIIALAALAILTHMILRIGALMGACPISGRAARSAAITIATGFATIGLGGVVLAAMILPALQTSLVGLLGALGIACLALGLGFTQAVATLRGVVNEALSPAQKPLADSAVEGAPV